MAFSCASTQTGGKAERAVGTGTLKDREDVSKYKQQQSMFKCSQEICLIEKWRKG